MKLTPENMAYPDWPDVVKLDKVGLSRVPDFVKASIAEGQARKAARAKDKLKDAPSED